MSHVYLPLPPRHRGLARTDCNVTNVLGTPSMFEMIKVIINHRYTKCGPRLITALKNDVTSKNDVISAPVCSTCDLSCHYANMKQQAGQCYAQDNYVGNKMPIMGVLCGIKIRFRKQMRRVLLNATDNLINGNDVKTFFTDFD